MENYTFQATDGASLNCYRWLPEQSEIKGVIYLAHGMGEHAKRYDWTARQLNAAGFVVIANDHRGHGLTAVHLGDFGVDGWNRMLADMYELLQSLALDYPEQPKILMGHSMGALLCQQYITRYPRSYDKLVLSGSPGFNPGFLVWLSRQISRFEAWRLGPGKESTLLNFLVFGSANKAFESGADPITGFEWLSRDKAQVQVYIDDTLCGFVPFPAALKQMFDGVKAAQDQNNISQIDATKPCYLFLGTDDPVNNGLANIKRMLKAWSKVGLNPDEHFYAEGRHEMLNETNQQAVIDDLINWLQA